MRIECWRITGSAFHFGQQGLGQEETMINLPSDSLFSALLTRLATLETNAEFSRRIQPFLEGDPPFVLSSTFPFAGDVKFFPAPARIRVGQASTGALIKDMKKASFLSEGIFRQVIAGETLDKLFLDSVSRQDKAALLSKSENQALPEKLRSAEASLWKVAKRVRVTIGRSDSSANPFYTGLVHFAEKCGLWFAVRWLRDDPEWRLLLKRLLADLEHVGLGGERSVGYGACQIQPLGEIELPEAVSKPWINLSRYLPRREEINALSQAYSAYRLIQVTGWLASNTQPAQRRRSLNLVADGAILGPLDKPVPGQVVDLRPHYRSESVPFDHAVYRSGLAFAVGLQGVN